MSQYTQIHFPKFQHLKKQLAMVPYTVIPTFRSLRQENHKFDTTLGYLMKPTSKIREQYCNLSIRRSLDYDTMMHRKEQTRKKVSQGDSQESGTTVAKTGKRFCPLLASTLLSSPQQNSTIPLAMEFKWLIIRTSGKNVWKKVFLIHHS